jgi:FixJ family two-component response regulator
LIGPNCLGVMVPAAKLNATFATRMAMAGDLALVAQSGAIAAGMVEWAAQRNIGFSADGRELLDDPHLPACECLIVDQAMPGMCGLDVVDALRHRGIWSPAILITSNASRKICQCAATAGVVVIEKPFFGNALVDAIRDSLT